MAGLMTENRSLTANFGFYEDAIMKKNILDNHNYYSGHPYPLRKWEILMLLIS